MVDSACVVAGRISELPDWPGGDWSLVRALPANKDRYAAETDKDLRCTACCRIGDDRRPEHLDIPSTEAFGSSLMM